MNLEEATQKAKATVGIKADEPNTTGADLTAEANEVAGEAKGKKEEVKSKM